MKFELWLNSVKRTFKNGKRKIRSWSCFWCKEWKKHSRLFSRCLLFRQFQGIDVRKNFNFIEFPLFICCLDFSKSDEISCDCPFFYLFGLQGFWQASIPYITDAFPRFDLPSLNIGWVCSFCATESIVLLTKVIKFNPVDAMTTN